MSDRNNIIFICREDQDKFAVESHWRTPPVVERFILLKDNFLKFSRFPPLTIRSGDGGIIGSLDFISSQDTVHVVESPLRYEASGQSLDDLGLVKVVRNKICGAVGVLVSDENPSSGLRLPLASKVDKLENKFIELGALMNENVTKLEIFQKLSTLKARTLTINLI